MWLNDKSDTYKDEAVTLQGLARVLRTMRWRDLEEFAQDLNQYRCQDEKGEPLPKSSKSVTANHIQCWLEYMADMEGEQ